MGFMTIKRTETMPTRLTNEIVDLQLKKQGRNIIRIGGYINARTKIDWKCLKCNFKWSAVPYTILNKKSGCIKCSKKVPLNNRNVDKRLRSRSIARLGNVVNNKTKIDWECLKCGYKWKTTPTNVLDGGSGCKQCNKLRPLDDSYVDDILYTRKIYIKRLGNIVNARSKMFWECLICQHVWPAIPDVIINRRTGCPKCARKTYSIMGIKWLNDIVQKERIFIQHANNIGEYRISGTRFNVDGFCEETNTIYEFYGDVYHGNPEKFNFNDKCHPYDKEITAGELYQKTMEREKKIKSLGYNLVTIWESEWLTH